MEPARSVNPACATGARAHDTQNNVAVARARSLTCRRRFFIEGLGAAPKDDKAYVQAGAGLVMDSVPETEYLETQNKAAAPLRAVAIANALKKV